ncbi:transcriptional repressor [Gordonia phage Daredevil]|uniref:Immunity repressor n=1 Tax=Gordonia phage Daredevil TaxID=2283286 RepID=A0A345MIR2_9CAUD|nr:transcriptional repressor [Gordonia phage Daredevil]AXH70443.1 immunity repressor [Gordonia phage Daredevil]
MQSIAIFGKMLGRDVTRSEIAEALNVHVSTISRRMSGNEGFRLEEVMQMCDFFQVSRSQMLVELGHLDLADVAKVAGSAIQPLAAIPEIELLDELASRALARGEHAGVRTTKPRRRGRGFLS